MNIKQGMTNCQRCPRCHQIPTPKILANGQWELSCEKHGYFMTGDDLEHAVLYWNKAMDFFKYEMGQAA